MKLSRANKEMLTRALALNALLVKQADASTYDRHQVGMLECALYGYKNCLDKLNAGEVIGMYNGPVTENMSLYLDNINGDLTAAMVKVVMGEDISVYHDAVKAWYANGGEAITKEVNDYYASKK